MANDVKSSEKTPGQKRYLAYQQAYHDAEGAMPEPEMPPDGAPSGSNSNSQRSVKVMAARRSKYGSSGLSAQGKTNIAAKS